MDFSVPEMSDILARVTSVRSKDGDKKQSITEWRSDYKDKLISNRKKSSIAIFNTFVNNLLERATCSTTRHFWKEKFQDTFRTTT
jgi:hypothetical protein